ncbi:MAG: ACP S-malonyltransferase [Firmicutes bacterium]|nr:ACP S-malonyltransferase [Bacillota bacterium]
MSKFAMLFPGQGSQNVGMGQELCGKYPVAAQTFAEANDALGFDLKKLCAEGPMEELTKTFNSQPAILTTSVAFYRVFMEEYGATPLFGAGHSLGEITALTCAGAIDFADAVKIVRRRGQFMQEAVPEGVGLMMAVMGSDPETIAGVCAKISTPENLVVVSNYNSPSQTVISGHKEAVQKAGAELEALGAKTIPLKVSAPFHSPLMKPAAEKLQAEMQQYQYHDLKFPVLSNVTAKPYSGKDSLVKNLVEQLVQPVQWTNSMKYLQSQGIDLAVEIGSMTVLKDLMKKNVPEILALSYDKEADRKQLGEKLPKAASLPGGTVTVDKAMKLKLMIRCLAIVVCTRNQNWDNDEYQKGVVEPYRKIQALVDELEKENKEPTLEQMTEALEMLRLVFKTKKTPLEEQIERFNQVFNETGTRGLFPDFKMPE